MPVCASLPPPGSNLGMYRVALVNFLMNTHNFPPRCNARTFVLVYSYVFSQSISGAGPAYLPQLMSRASSQSNRLRRACNQGPRLSPHPTNGRRPHQPLDLLQLTNHPLLKILPALLLSSFSSTNAPQETRSPVMTSSSSSSRPREILLLIPCPDCGG